MGASTEKKVQDIKDVLTLASEMGKRGFKTEKSQLKEIARSKARRLVKSLKPRRSKQGQNATIRGTKKTLNWGI